MVDISFKPCFILHPVLESHVSQPCTHNSALFTGRLSLILYAADEAIAGGGGGRCGCFCIVQFHYSGSGSQYKSSGCGLLRPYSRGHFHGLAGQAPDWRSLDGGLTGAGDPCESLSDDILSDVTDPCVHGGCTGVCYQE